MITVLRLGAFDVALEQCSRDHADLLEGLFRTRVEAADNNAPCHVRLTLGAGETGATFGSGVALKSWEEGARTFFVSDVIAGFLDRTSRPCLLDLRIDESNPHVRHLDLYLRIVLNAVLRRLDRLRLHAAAVNFAGTTSLFVGEKGAGKTTISLYLARAGGTVLGEDQIMIRRATGDLFVAAGSDAFMRVTAKTEAHFFSHALQARSMLVAGVAKKEIEAADHVRCEPNREYRLHRIFFPEIGAAFAIKPLTAREALARLAAPLLPINRFTSDADRQGFIAFLGGLTRQARSFSLTLTPELADLGSLSEFLA